MRRVDAVGVEPRRLGTGLLALGIIGVLLAGIVAIGLLVGAFAARGLEDRLHADQLTLAATLERVSLAIERVGVTVDNASTTLATSSQAMSEASAAMNDMATASGTLADTMEIEILGNRPFAGAAESFRTVESHVGTLAATTDQLAANLATNATDVAALSEPISDIEAAVDDLAGRVTEFDRTDEIVGLIVASTLLLGLLAGWLAISAACLAWFGLRLRRSPTKSA